MNLWNADCQFDWNSHRKGPYKPRDGPISLYTTFSLLGGNMAIKLAFFDMDGTIFESYMDWPNIKTECRES